MTQEEVTQKALQLLESISKDPEHSLALICDFYFQAIGDYNNQWREKEPWKNIWTDLLG